MKAFTLVEVLVSIAIFTVIFAGIFAALNMGQKSWQSESALIYLQQQARQAMDGMVREVRQAKTSDVTISEDGATIQFRIPASLETDPVTYSQAISYSLSNNQIIREHPSGTTRPLANDISDLDFSFSLDAADILEISLEAQKVSMGRTLTFSLEEKARLCDDD